MAYQWIRLAERWTFCFYAMEKYVHHSLINGNHNKDYWNYRNAFNLANLVPFAVTLSSVCRVSSAANAICTHICHKGKNCRLSALVSIPLHTCFVGQTNAHLIVFFCGHLQKIAANELFFRSTTAGKEEEYHLLIDNNLFRPFNSPDSKTLWQFLFSQKTIIVVLRWISVRCVFA